MFGIRVRGYYDTVMQILLVDDEKVVLEVLVRLLEYYGHTVQCVCDGMEAWQFIERWPVDLVVSDIRMPGMDGLQLAQAISEKRSDVPVILISGYATEEIKNIQTVVYKVMQKPLSIEELLKTVQEIESIHPSVSARCYDER